MSPIDSAGILHVKNGCKAIAKRKCGSGESSGVASPIYKQASLAGRLMTDFEIGLISGINNIITGLVTC